MLRGWATVFASHQTLSYERTLLRTRTCQLRPLQWSTDTACGWLCRKRGRRIAALFKTATQVCTERVEIFKNILSLWRGRGEVRSSVLLCLKLSPRWKILPLTAFKKRHCLDFYPFFRSLSLFIFSLVAAKKRQRKKISLFYKSIKKKINYLNCYVNHLFFHNHKQNDWL